MKYLTERTEIAKFFNENPVIRINAEKPEEGYEYIFKGELVKVQTPSKNHPTLFTMGTMIWDSLTDRFYVMSGGACISSDFVYADVMERFEWNHAPIVAEGDVVGILEDYPTKKQCRIRVMQAIRCNSLYSEVCVFKDLVEGKN